ncbi:MAG TPA: L-threonylcarbamoyladenylate synthase, partial [Pirellulales bacterium]|nr:L-threonylcarbamoyladenylate synthase [Pirellulales bacterium]
MPTVVSQVDPQHPDAAAIERAAALLRAGRLVAFPTETVYGLGANALDPHAVARIYEAKGRPVANPIIVHVATVDQARQLTTTWPTTAMKLVERFWPGPLTIVLPKRDTVPAIVTAGGPTVALRMPRHAVAQALLREAKLPLAAPSANRSTRISPTTAAHVLRTLADRVDLVLDAGPCAGGLESTVLDLSQDRPRLLRPGLVTLAELESALAMPLSTRSAERTVEPARSPGLMPRHYAPSVPLECIEGEASDRIGALISQGLRVGWIGRRSRRPTSSTTIVRELPDNAAGFAAGLYSAL